MRLRYVLLFFLSLGMAFLLPHCARENKLQEAAPDFNLKSLENEEVSLSSLKGKVVLLDFWATWCSPCRESIPHLVQLQRKYGEKGFQVIGLSVDKGDDKVVRHFVKSVDIPYPVVIAPEEVARSYSVTSLPTTLFIDKNGKVREKIVGFSSAIAGQMAAKVEELIAETP